LLFFKYRFSVKNPEQSLKHFNILQIQ